jgi:hypothetical protein
MLYKLIFPLLLLVASSVSLTAQTKYVNRSNLTYDPNGKRFIYEYDLISEKPSKVEVNITYKGVPLTNPHVKGDVGSCVKKGTGKKIIWYCTQDIPNWAGVKEDVNFEVVAKPPKSYKGGKTLGVLFMLAGAGSAVQGYLMYDSALADYSVYKENTNPSDALWANQSRSNYFTATNTEYKNGQYLLAAGGSALLIGSILLINKSKKARKSGSKDCAYQSPGFAPSIVSVQANPTGVGLKIAF